MEKGVFWMDKNWKQMNKCACLNEQNEKKNVFFEWMKIENEKINENFLVCLNEQRNCRQKYTNHTKSILY